MTSDEKITRELLEFIRKSPTAFHTIANIRGLLADAGYTELSEGESWKLEKGGRYFTVRNESSVIAFRIPEGAYAGFMIAASHSDSPTFKVKANPEMSTAGAYVKLNVEKYGGMLISPWFDRPLSVAGRLIVKEGNRFLTKLVNVDRDLCMIPSLAIHMNRQANDGTRYNVQMDVLPLLGDENSEGKFMDIIADAAGVKKEDIVGDDLFLYSRSQGTIWGAENQYVSSGHLDDLQCTYADLRGFVESGEEYTSAGIDMSGTAPDKALDIDNVGTISDESINVDAKARIACIPVLAVFDNEEVGSGTKQGADSTFLEDVLVRIGQNLGLSQEELRTKIASSFMVSADNAHAVHPNAEAKADPVNRPKMNCGIVIKYNANQKYTTDAVSAAIFREIAGRAGVPVQEFTNRSDIPGGSTLGNISNAHISLNTVDIGLPQLAMHSPYETAGVKDTAMLVKAARTLFGSALKDEGKGNYLLV